MLVLLALMACSEPTGNKDAPADTARDTSTDSGDVTVEPPTCSAPPRLRKVNEYWSALLPTVDSFERTLQGVALGDVDGDGWLDAVMAYGGGSAVMRNDGAGNLVLDSRFTMDGGPLPSAQAVALADLDADGDLDMFLGRDRGHNSRILTNLGDGAFSSVALPGLPRAAMTGAFADYDRDGDVDLFVAATVTETDARDVVSGETTRGDGDRIYMQQADGTWVDETEARIPADSDYGWTFQGAPIDYDGDGDLDLYLAHDMGPYILPNRLLKNDGAGHFTRAADCACELVMYAMAAAVGDANEDGLPDLYSTNVGPPYLLLNMGDGGFVDATLARGAIVPPSETNLTSWGAAFADLNLDSRIDLLSVYGQLGQPDFASTLEGTNPEWTDGGEQLSVAMLGGAEGTFTHATDAWTEGVNERALAVGDIDRDGVPDVVTVGKYFFRHYRNEEGCGPGVRVVLKGSGLDPQAFGARVDVDVGGRIVTQWMLPSTTGSQSALELHFGLGGLSGVRGGTVTWPDGTVSTFGPAAGGDTVTVEQDGGR